MSFAVSQYKHDVFAQLRELRECWHEAKKLEKKIKQEATTGDDGHKRQNKREPT